ncbi:hypothetical protein [Acidovorax sp. A1169]|uniref:hypothetical protein n=1 Tax=Acidovorax sp. A1169 TaxID=3059524 RepID=UPI002737EBB7|nr:hypothetical protein [Acidovorax sp. A1169]MDP4078910.1 hypothetical protein [Acidovorax sp. A1169]
MIERPLMTSTYTCIGFDIRVWPCDGIPSVGLSGWSQHDAMHATITREFGLQENLYQLLDIKDQETLDAVTLAIQANGACNLIAIQIPQPVATWQNERFGHPLGNPALSLAGFQCMGIDVADINGFFSILSFEPISKFRKSTDLIDERNLDEVLHVVQLAGFADRGHAPYCAVKISALKV